MKLTMFTPTEKKLENKLSWIVKHHIKRYEKTLSLTAKYNITKEELEKEIKTQIIQSVNNIVQHSFLVIGA